MAKKRDAVNWVKIADKVKATDKKVLAEVVKKIDGHTIYDPKAFTEAGLDPVIVKAFTKEQFSGNMPKETIYTDEGAVDSLKGVYGLDLLEFIARVFGVSSWKMGRGSRAGHLIEQLLPLWQEAQKEAVATS